eukprot:TRINITY_DN7473_c0_g3_i1.p2 TRINITY_DN7473_c0_g3~~TRINITY_DN7473_c0_g3_i1.p2  ORF type:complete len:170 (+),score=19.82 TRINITY_DN7473_c0_g3_i1:309-818(+)
MSMALQTDKSPIFGQIVYAFFPKPLRSSAFSPVAERCIFLGYHQSKTQVYLISRNLLAETQTCSWKVPPQYPPSSHWKQFDLHDDDEFRPEGSDMKDSGTEQITAGSATARSATAGSDAADNTATSGSDAAGNVNTNDVAGAGSGEASNSNQLGHGMPTETVAGGLHAV